MRAGDAEASSLMRWLAFYADDAQEDCVSVVLRLLTLAFPTSVEDLKDLDGWKAVMATLESFYEANLAFDAQKLEGDLNDTLKTVLELVLGAVVQCEAKDKFVKDILTMEDVVQADLMTIIEKVMTKGAVLFSEAVEDKDKQTPGINSPLYLSRNAALERVKRENEVLKMEHIHLAQELEQTTKKFHETGAEREKLVDMVRELTEQVTADALRKERAMHAQYDDQIQKLQADLESTKAELSEKTALASRVPALSDEVDLLRPLAEKIKKLDSTVAKYKAKIDELSGAKDSLRRLERTNAELMEKNLALESEVAKGVTWQWKLKEAKEANTAAEFRVSELESLLARERQEHATSRVEFEASQEALQESKKLNAQLQEAAGHLSAVEATESCSSAPTIAGGISEFNPEIMQKLTRLEYENTELKRRIDNETGARIDSLLDEIDDMTRLKASFETKYFETQQTLQSTQSEFKKTKRQLECEVAELQMRTRDLSEWQVCFEEDIAAQVLEKQTVVAARDRLATELSDIVKHEHQLIQEVSRLGRELSEMREASDTIACRNKMLAEQLEYISRKKENLEATLARHFECAAMQTEDTNAGWLRLLDQVCRRYEDQAAATISRMTLLVDEKSTEVELLTLRLQQDKQEHDSDLDKLNAARNSIMKKLERYQEQYSVSNADWSAKEEELNSRVKELDALCCQCKQQEESLKSTIKSQLQSNARLVAKNKAMKANIVENRDIIAQLESATTRLESKVALLEKERGHFAAQEKRKRHVEDGMSSYSSQLSTQVSLAVAELEKVLTENQELHAKLVGCRCGHESPTRSGASDSGQKAKTYYLTRIQQVEHDKQQVEHKRRELLLVNAKLVQEQKQLHVRNMQLSTQIHDLEESVNHWRLRDERRRTKERESTLSIEKGIRFASAGAKSAVKKHSTEKEASTRRDCLHKTSQKLISELSASTSKPLSRESPVSASPIDKTNEHSSNPTKTTSHGNRKRKLETDDTTSDIARSTSTAAASADAENDFTEATTFFSLSSLPFARASSNSSSEYGSKRRLSHFITRDLVPDKNTPPKEKLSECNQQ